MKVVLPIVIKAIRILGMETNATFAQYTFVPPGAVGACVVSKAKKQLLI
jgi:hypothetical protein